MKDTCHAIEERFLEMMKLKTGEERLRMGFEMYEMARGFVEASITLPKYSEGFLIGVFNRFYGQDLSVGIRRDFIEELKKRVGR